MIVENIVSEISKLSQLAESKRVYAYNAIVRAASNIVRDVSGDPATCPQLIPAARIVGNSYNPNTVAGPELDLLEQSMRADGITMCVVVMKDADEWTVVDGFHRHKVGTSRLGRRYIPCSVIDRPLADRMASTIRHNRARGKHQVELMGALVRSMLGLGWDDERIAESLGMSIEELLRLKQVVGVAVLMAAERYGEFYGRDDEPPLPPEDEP